MIWICENDRELFQSEGYMLIRNVVPEHLIQPACIEIARAVGANLRRRRSWYKGEPQNDGLVPYHHLQSVWNIRQDPDVYAAFSEFWGGETRLYTDINRSCFRPPCHRKFPELSRGEIHWDIDPRKGSDGWIQGIVLLTDIKQDNGGFQCIPDVYKNIDKWLAENASHDSFDHFYPGLNDHPAIIQLEGKAGDILIWSTLLPHGPARNLAKIPRIATFLTLTPNKNSHEIKEEMTTLIAAKRAPEKWRGLPGQLDPEPGEPVYLTTLGKKLTAQVEW